MSHVRHVDVATLHAAFAALASPARSGCLTALMIGGGIVLLLPGVCAILIIGFDPRGLANRDTLMACLSFFGVAAGGVVLIWLAVRPPR
jgi:hypothetical protein